MAKRITAHPGPAHTGHQLRSGENRPVAAVQKRVPTRETGFNVGDDPGCQVFPRAGAYSIAARHSVPEKLFISTTHNA
eukprot:scaffold666837_cov62-Prasinocladus_malaysianus.AAC.1